MVNGISTIATYQAKLNALRGKTRLFWPLNAAIPAIPLCFSRSLGSVITYEANQQGHSETSALQALVAVRHFAQMKQRDFVPECCM